MGRDFSYQFRFHPWRRFVLWLFAVTFLSIGCNHYVENKKSYEDYGRIIDSHTRLRSIKTYPIILGEFLDVFLMNDLLIVQDGSAPETTIHLYGKKEFNYILSTGRRGRGPGEIAREGHLVVDKVGRRFFCHGLCQAVGALF